VGSGDGVKHVTDAEVLAAAEAAVAEKGADYVYAKPKDAVGMSASECLYVHGEEAGCLVGNVLHRLGVPLSTLRDCEGVHAIVALGRVEERDRIILPAWSKSMLIRAQAQQDNGETWGDALTEGKVYANQRRKAGVA
jgi:hypothetical protein